MQKFTRMHVMYDIVITPAKKQRWVDFGFQLGSVIQDRTI